MMFNFASLISAAVLALPLTALAAPTVPVNGAGLEDRSRSKTHKVTVGKGGKLRYHPQYVRAKVGDTIKFEFYPTEHSVSETLFDKPCRQITNGFDTGVIPVEDGASDLPTRTFKVTSKEPRWFYSNELYRCTAGMVFAVNPPKTGNTFKKFLNNAIHTEE